ncbi:hypothetical protein BT69DRAFT_1284282 [Atractiella rhizophila]|nr:hypothetical protein BT69DRAFT_1284282 [Atractiella rhizophila]
MSRKAPVQACFPFEKLPTELQLAVLHQAFVFSDGTSSRVLKRLSLVSRKIRALVAPDLFRYVCIGTFDPTKSSYDEWSANIDVLSLSELFRFTETVHLYLLISHFGHVGVEEKHGRPFFYLDQEKLVGLGKTLQSQLELILSRPDNQVDSIQITFSESGMELLDERDDLDLSPSLKLILQPLKLKSDVNLFLAYDHSYDCYVLKVARRSFFETFQALPPHLRIRSLTLEALELCYSNVGLPTNVIVDDLTLSCNSLQDGFDDLPTVSPLPPLQRLTIQTALYADEPYSVYASTIFEILKICPDSLEELSLCGQILPDPDIPLTPASRPLFPSRLRRLQVLEQFQLRSISALLDQLAVYFSAAPIQVLVLDSESLHTIAVKEEDHEFILDFFRETFGKQLSDAGFPLDGQDPASNIWASIFHSLVEQRKKGGWPNLSTVCLGRSAGDLARQGILKIDSSRALLTANGLALCDVKEERL